jgi:hypothetical protein
MKLLKDQRFQSVGLTDTQLLGPNFKRLAVLISAPLQNRITLAFGMPAVLDQGITLYPGAAPLYLTMDMIGQSIREEIHAITTVGAQSIGALDLFFP